MSMYYFNTLENPKNFIPFFGLKKEATLKRMARETVRVYEYYTFLLVTELLLWLFLHLIRMSERCFK